jgi:hypothetical protein
MYKKDLQEALEILYSVYKRRYYNNLDRSLTLDSIIERLEELIENTK